MSTRAPNRFAICVISAMGRIVPRLFDACASDTTLVRGPSSDWYDSIMISPRSVTGITRRTAPRSLAIICQGTMLA